MEELKPGSMHAACTQAGRQGRTADVSIMQPRIAYRVFGSPTQQDREGRQAGDSMRSIPGSMQSKLPAACNQ
jgi:hypothetical protein